MAEVNDGERAGERLAANAVEEVGALVRELKDHARSLPPEQRRQALRLREELATWETTRAEQVGRAGARLAVRAQATRTLAIFDGVPGVGKTSHIDRLVAEVGADYLSMARFAEARGVSQEERRSHQLGTGSLHPTDVQFLEAVTEQRGRLLVLEKFPRTPVEAVALVDLARREGWRLEGIHLFFPRAPIAASVRRQLERGPRRGKEITEHEATRRAMSSLARSSSGRWTLRDLGVPIHHIDSTQPPQENDAAIRRALGLDLASLPWDLAPLQELEAASRRLGIEAWVSAGGLYRPFWNGRFGPIQLPTDVDVAVQRQADVAPLLQSLRLVYPRRRWSVLCPGDVLRRRLGVETGSIEEAKSYAAFLHRAGVVRWTGSSVEVRLAEGAEASLWTGEVRLNERLFAELSEEARREELAHAAAKLGRTLRDYPGLRIDPETASKLGGEVERHRSARILTAWRPLKSEVVRTQHDPREAAFCRRALGPREREIAEEILRFHRQSEFRPSAPRILERVALPAPLEAIREARERRKAGLPITAEDARLLDAELIEPPGGHASWLHHVALEEDDSVFREWLLDQVHHHRPVGGGDRFLRRLLDFSLFEALPRELSREQSPMHQGWTLERHLAASALELETDALRERFDTGTGPLRFEELRLCMRLAMLFHDTGKLVRPRGRSTGAPRRHAHISARLWTRYRPDWFPEPLVPTVRWMIATHDLFGAFGRGITEKRGRKVGDYSVDLALQTSYFSALDAQAVRERLLDSGLSLPDATAINGALWRADIGSISTLRWLLPVAELVERLVLEGNGSERRSRGDEGGRRRRTRQGPSQRRRGGGRRGSDRRAIDER